MERKIRKLKDKASARIASGDYDDARDLLLKVLEYDASDHGSRQKLGDMYRKLGHDAQAIAAYQAVVGGYAAEGRLAKAMAICKVILQIDPTHKETQKTLAELYARRSGNRAPAELPAAMAASLHQDFHAPASIIRGRRASQIGMPAAKAVAKIDLKKKPAAPTTPPAQKVAPQRADSDFAIEVDMEAILEMSAPQTPSAECPEPEAKFFSGAYTATPGEKVELSARTETSVPAGAEIVLENDIVEASAPEFAPAVDPTEADEPIVVIEEPALTVAPPTQRASAGEDDMFEFAVEVDEDEEAVALEPLDDREVPESVVVFDDLGAFDEAFAEFEEEVPVPRFGIDPEQLPPIPLFGELGKAAFLELLTELELKSYPAGEIVMKAGDKGNSLAIIAAGSVRVEKPRAGQRPLKLARLKEGDFFGEMALLGYGLRTADVIAEEELDVLEITRAQLNKLIKTHPSMRNVLKRFYKNNLLRQLFRSSPIFLPFDREQQKELLGRFKKIRVERGKAVLKQGQEGSGLFVIMSGRCQVELVEGHKKKALATLAEGDVFGEMSLLTGEPAMATVRARSKTLLLKLPKSAFRELIMTHPQVLEMVSALSAERSKIDNVALRAQPREQVRHLT